MSSTATYLRTLRRIPDDIVLSIATREIVPDEPEYCICGWAIRESIARATNRDAAHVQKFGVTFACHEAFGGTLAEWSRVFSHIVWYTAEVERAFVTRVMEAAGVAR